MITPEEFPIFRRAMRIFWSGLVQDKMGTSTFGVNYVLTSGFGDPALDGLAKEIIRLRLEGDVLDSGALARHLASQGFGALLSEIDKAADRSGAPFLNPDLQLAAARALWSQAFESLTRMAALESALDAAKADLADADSAARFLRLKAERDALKRAIRTGTIWTDGAS